MKAPTTLLAERAMAKQPVLEDPLASCREAAIPLVADAVVDACTFSRPSNQAARMVSSRMGLITRQLYKKTQEMRAGGLPEHFLLVVTRDELIALEQKPIMRRGGGMETGAEVARWRRADLTVSSSPAGYLINVTLVSPGEDEQVKCCVGKSTVTEDFVRLLGDPTRQTRAVS